MKKIILSAVAFLASAMSMSAAVNELTVADGTNKSSYAPINSTWYDTEGADGQSQVIYSADMLTDMVDNTITGVKYYFESATTMQGGQYDVAAGITDKNAWTLFDDTPISDLPIVKANATIAESGLTELEITFDTPIEYKGGNLVIATYVTQNGTYGAMPYFAGANQSSMVNNYSYYNTGAETRYYNTGVFMPKTTFYYTNVATGIDNLNGTAAVKSVKYVNTMGQVSNTPFDGVNIVVTELADGTQQSVKVLK